MPSDNQYRDELQEQFEASIRADKNFEIYFKDYTPSSVKSFVNHYALQKAMWTTYGPTFKDILEKLETQWVNEATERLAEIQQVKLFLFQCRYRAGLVEEPVEKVRTIFDFVYWRHNILNAPFLEPVTEHDIELYSDYMLSNDAHSHPFYSFLEDWQDFAAIRNAYNDGEVEEEEEYDDDEDEEESEPVRRVPDWYEFYFSHTGTGIELTLPDVKKDKDLFYFNKGNNERVRLLIAEDEKGIAEKIMPPKEKGDYFNGSADGAQEAFMEIFEDKDNIQKYAEYEKWSSFNERESMLRDDLDILFYANENVEIEGGESWIYAVQLAAARYRTRKIAESLPAAFEQYKLKQSLGILYPEDESSVKESTFYNDLVLLGRKLLGEPENFDY